MRFITALLCCITVFASSGQSLQFHYDIRHTLDPGRNQKNFPTLYFEYFKIPDSAKGLVSRGAFLLKLQADFTGDKNNIGKYYMQVSQDLRFWRPKFFLNLQYGGGLGVTEPKQYSYYIQNTYCAGISYPFRFGKAYFSSVLDYKFVSYAKPSSDFLYTFYFYKGWWNYKAEFQGDFSLWTENKNHGDDATKGMTGKRCYFFAEPQFWYRIGKSLAVGTRINMNYHVLTTDNVFQVYPTAGIRWKP